MTSDFFGTGRAAYKPLRSGSSAEASIFREAMFLKILARPFLPGLNFHMPLIVDLSHPVVMLQGDNGSAGGAVEPGSGQRIAAEGLERCPVYADSSE